MLPISYRAVGDTTHDDTDNHLCHHTIMCVHQSCSKCNHARGKATNGKGDHSRRFVNVGIGTAHHYTTYNRAKHHHTVSSTRVFFGPPRPLPRCHSVKEIAAIPSKRSPPTTNVSYIAIFPICFSPTATVYMPKLVPSSIISILFFLYF